MIDARFKSIKSWPKKPTPATERRNRFRSSWQQTLDLIEAELSKLKAGDIVIEAYFRPEDIRNDGWPRSNARPSHPGVVLKFATKKGQMEFACDKFKDYQQNLRAIGMGLEKLRMVEDYGIVTEAEQYTGWLKLPAASADDEATECAKILIQFASRTAPDSVVLDTERILSVQAAFDQAWKFAVSAAHPDKPSGNAEDFKVVISARDRIRQLKGWS